MTCSPLQFLLLEKLEARELVLLGRNLFTGGRGKSAFIVPRRRPPSGEPGPTGPKRFATLAGFGSSPVVSFPSTDPPQARHLCQVSTPTRTGKSSSSAARRKSKRRGRMKANPLPKCSRIAEDSRNLAPLPIFVGLFEFPERGRDYRTYLEIGSVKFFPSSDRDLLFPDIICIRIGCEIRKPACWDWKPFKSREIRKLHLGNDDQRFPENHDTIKVTNSDSLEIYFYEWSKFTDRSSHQPLRSINDLSLIIMIWSATWLPFRLRVIFVIFKV